MKAPLSATLVLALALAALPFAGGCFFGEPQKRGSIEDELAVETDLALRTLDGADIANAIPSLATLAENAGRMDEVGLRIQTVMLIARTLDEEAALWPADKEITLRRAARRQATIALGEAEDWRRFEPESKEAALLVHDARILRARLSPEMADQIEPLLEAALPDAVAHGDLPRVTAWRLALCRVQLDAGRLGEARRTLSEAKIAFARAGRTVKKDDPAGEALRLAMTEAEGDVAAFGGQPGQADALYGQALEMARKLRRRGEIKRILLKLAFLAEESGQAERSAWYLRRADSVARMPPGDIMREQTEKFADDAGGGGGTKPEPKF